MSAPLPDDLLSAYLDGELDPGTRAEVEAKLASSEVWRAELVAVRGARDALRALPMLDPPAGFWERLLAEGPEASPDRGDETTVVARRRRLRRAWAAGGAAALLVVAVALPSESKVRPPVASMVRSHAAGASEGAEPITQLAPVARPVSIGR